MAARLGSLHLVINDHGLAACIWGGRHCAKSARGSACGGSPQDRDGVQRRHQEILQHCHSRRDYALFEAARNLDRALDRIEQVADICWNDIEKYCSHLPEGGGRIAQCLATQRTSLTPACQTEIGKFQSGK